MKKPKMYVVILNYDFTSIDVVDITDCPDDVDVDDYLNDYLDYNMRGCNWMVVYGKPYFTNIKRNKTDFLTS